MARFSKFVAIACILVGLPAAHAEDWKPVDGRIMTRWAKDVTPANALPEYPRPQMVRAKWQCLNGLWEFGLTASDAASPPDAFGGHILVPFPYESALSGVGKPSIPDQRLWYRRTFTVPADWAGQHVLLHFGAVTWDSTVFVNGKPMGRHKGGFDGFEYDITGGLKPGDNTLAVSAWNPMPVDTADAQVVGKQRVHPGGIFYTGSTGIWQTVWIEPVPELHVDRLVITPDVDHQQVTIAAVGTLPSVSGPPQMAVAIFDDGKEVARGGINQPIHIGNPHLWSPDDPHLYTFKTVAVNKPFVNFEPLEGYFAMRKVSLGKDEKGRSRIFLNNKFVFEVGALDQGYWPDGIYTAPTDAALKSDIEAAKAFGFNLLRKHAKVEPDRWYYWTDKLGILVWQDMPQCFGPRGAKGIDGGLTADARSQWLAEWQRIVTERGNHPSIIVWTTFNEGWGQHETDGIVATTKQWDPTRLINNASGWTDKNVGDIRDTHKYPGPWCETDDTGRAVVNGEFGGITMRVPGHQWGGKLFGYGSTLKSGRKVTNRYQQLLKAAYQLRDDRGASAVVYTQLTDVEGESNGLLTYDREVTKPLAEFVTAANNGKFPPLPAAPVSAELIPTSVEDPQTWSYTTDKPADGWFKPDFDSAAWKTGKAPFGQGYAVNTPWTDTPGDIWLRRTVTLPATIPPNLVVRTEHDEDVEVYVNGVLAASATGYVGEYVDLPMSAAAKAAIKEGTNVIAVHCRQTVGAQVIDVGIAEAGK